MYSLLISGYGKSNKKKKIVVDIRYSLIIFTIKIKDSRWKTGFEIKLMVWVKKSSDMIIRNLWRTRHEDTWLVLRAFVGIGARNHNTHTE